MLGESGEKLVEKGEWGSVVVGVGDLVVFWWCFGGGWGSLEVS
jgi:hypothetical protein